MYSGLALAALVCLGLLWTAPAALSPALWLTAPVSQLARVHHHQLSYGTTILTVSHRLYECTPLPY